ncbi:hypothetical protein BDA96_02G226100 [Sorghum bicolor]|uniref:Uncharacterized protein n=1 Tax=Sorghum bicolor TaxID=4558 RepID=A0A921RNQ9_SORBI|nr:hypothetical protein BDA96_02G226100 [Sorghum bicolor]
MPPRVQANCHRVQAALKKIEMGNKEMCSLYATMPFLSHCQHVANPRADSALNRPNRLL